jgi:putative transposase
MGAAHRFAYPTPASNDGLRPSYEFLLATSAGIRYKTRMTDYRRNRVPGGTYFFTVNLFNRGSRLLVEKIDILRNAVREVKSSDPFHIDAWVVLPEHLHCIWTLPEGDEAFSSRWQAIKAKFSESLPAGEYRSMSRVEKGERGIWQRRFWEHTIRDDTDYAAHMDYIHFNPVKHCLVSDARDWPHSSFHRAIRRGLYPPQWAGRKTDPTTTGEP